MGSGVAGSTAPASPVAGPVWALMERLDPLAGLGKVVVKSSSRQRASPPASPHVPVNVRGKVSGLRGGGGVPASGGAAVSGCTHDVMSKNMNSSAFSCALIGACTH